MRITEDLTRLRPAELATREDREAYFRPVAAASGPVVSMEGRRVLMLGSSNSLRLARDPRITDDAPRAIDPYGTATNGSPILIGTLDLHEQLERELAEWLGTEAA